MLCGPGCDFEGGPPNVNVRSETDVRARVAALNAEIAKANSRVVEGPPTRLASLLVDEIVSEWRARRTRSG